MNRKMKWALLWIAIGFFGFGIVGFHLTEPQTSWGRAIQWVIMFVMTPGSDFEPTNPTSAWFQSVYAVVNFLALTLALSTIVIPPMLSWWGSRLDGSGSCRRQRGHLIIDAIDWEKARSIVEVLQQEKQSGVVRLVVVSETLDDLPIDLYKLGVRFVKGNLRSRETYTRAGLEHAKGAILCASDYNNPEIGDATTSAYVWLIEEYRRDVVTAAEVVVEDHAHLFNMADHAIVFDPTVLNNVASQVAAQLDGRAGNIIYKAFDEAQADEFERQLLQCGVVQEDSGVVVHVLLPVDLNDPKISDLRVFTEARQIADGLVVPVYLSIESRDLFSCWEDTAVCADQVMAQALVAALHRGATASGSGAMG